MESFKIHNRITANSSYIFAIKIHAYTDYIQQSIYRYNNSRVIDVLLTERKPINFQFHRCSWWLSLLTEDAQTETIRLRNHLNETHGLIMNGINLSGNEQTDTLCHKRTNFTLDCLLRELICFCFFLLKILENPLNVNNWPYLDRAKIIV